jgi:hypothetical protein
VATVLVEDVTKGIPPSGADNHMGSCNWNVYVASKYDDGA